MTDEYIEQDALNDSASFDSALHAAAQGYAAEIKSLGAYIQARDHIHNHEIKSFIAAPRMDVSAWAKLKGLFKPNMRPGMTVYKGADGLRYMFIITSNSYEDRDDETITSQALKSYEASCYLGDDLFHCDNPLLWWHDDDVVMGEIVAVNYSEPFLVEVAKELPSHLNKILWDFAERNGDNAGASHRFGYREEDKQADNSYTQIYKQETTYLPERALAANWGTYAGVLSDMSTAASDKRLDAIIFDATGGAIKDAAAKIHAKTGELEKALAALDIQHKAVKPDVEAVEVDAAVGDEVVGETKEGLTPDFISKLQKLEAIYQMMAALMQDQQTGLDAEIEMAKRLKVLEEIQITKQKAQEDVEQRLRMVETRLNLSQRRASQVPETNPEHVKASLDAALKSGKDAELETNAWGWKVKPAPLVE